MNIDWSKAPEGATHFAPQGKGLDARWFDMDKKRVRVFHNDQWEDINFWAGRTDLIPKPALAEWTGEGLPPVGMVCECHLPGELTNNYSWVEAKVIWHNGPTECAVVRSTSKLAWCDEFRPIRTPEQIAAEKREVAIQKMLAECPYPGSHDGVARLYTEALYDAGYRKQVSE